MCDNCDYKSDLINDDELEVCKECFKKEPKVLTTQSDAIEKYPITKTDLEDVRRVEYKGVYMTYLFLIKDVENICIKKYGSKEEYKKVFEEKNKKKNERKNFMQKHKDLRRKELDDYLKTIGMPGIRDDSMLCINYIEKGERGGFNKEQIGNTMLEMEFYYKKTFYKTILSTMRDNEREDMREYKGYYRWTDDDEEDVRNRAKDQSLYGFVKQNYENTHKLIIDIPPSLKAKADKYYEEIKSKNIKKQPKMIVVNVEQPIEKPKLIPNDTISELSLSYKSSMQKFSETQKQYTSVLTKVKTSTFG